MKRGMLFVLTIALLLSSGCIVRSLHGINTEANTIFDPALLGHFNKPNSTETVHFYQDGTENRYILLYTDDEFRSGEFYTHLVKLGDHLFLDLYPCMDETSRSSFFDMHLLPVHSFVLVDKIGPELELREMDLGWLEKYLSDNPDEIAHTTLESNIVLTADTPDIQKFLLDHVDTEGAFSEVESFKRME